MRFEEFTKKEIAERKIKRGQVAPFLGLTEQSFRNKLSKKNLNLHDAVILGAIFDLDLSLVDSTGKAVYQFSTYDYTSDDEAELLQSLKKEDDMDYLKWFSSLPQAAQKILFESMQ